VGAGKNDAGKHAEAIFGAKGNPQADQHEASKIKREGRTDWTKNGETKQSVPESDPREREGKHGVEHRR